MKIVHVFIVDYPSRAGVHVITRIPWIWFGNTFITGSFKFKSGTWFSIRNYTSFSYVKGKNFFTIFGVVIKMF